MRGCGEGDGWNEEPPPFERVLIVFVKRLTAIPAAVTSEVPNVFTEVDAGLCDDSR